MAQSTNTLDRYDLATNGENAREDLRNIITDISPTETPFTSSIGRDTATNTFTEWLMDSLASANASNAHIDGDEFSGDALATPARLGNFCQISRKDLVVSRRANIVNKAGRRQEMAYQIAKAGKELKRDVEAVLLSNQAGAAGDASNASKAAGLPTWIGVAVSSEVDSGNTDRGSGGADPALSSTNDGFPNSAATDGTVRALTEDGLLGVIKACYVNGSNPNVIMMGPTVKQQFSKYMFSTNSRIATPYQDYGKNQRDGVGVVGAVDVYVSDFGVLDVIPNRLQRQVSNDYVDVFVLDTEYAKVSYLDDYKTETIAQVGDAERRTLLVDYSLVIPNPGAHGIFADVDDDAAMTAS